ncbi:transcriptional regulator, LysR family [Arboricoccus pini]|uniref:Transcriptional regulator, LysR family n=1 Tax=Arboricoccus pini TaxID=1963835 RepID=A0A212RI73_9PROT|nr:LysR family transcriptional regulator [Arboricoccus pini]SNB72092.1 transcriptional regulator, LysR family [Arboricoccus pini]
MATNIDWDDLRTFLTLAREGSLTGAARKLDVSHPTIARRIKVLEASVRARLFDRLPDRFVPTVAGVELLADAEAMERAAESIHRRSAGLADTARGTVRISASEAMTTFLARHLPRLRRDLAHIEFELVASHLLANLSRREADLLIREQVPDTGSLMTRRVGKVAYGIYAAASLQVDDRSLDNLRTLPWCGFDDDHSYMPGHGWIISLLGGERPSVRVNNWLILQESVRAGAGLSLLPCCLGDDDPHLQRLGAPLPEIIVDQWLLVHRDLRDLPRIRAVIDALVRLFQEMRPILEATGSAEPSTASCALEARA